MSQGHGIQRHRTRYRFRDEIHDIRVVDVFPQRHRYLQFEDSAQGAIALDDLNYAVFEYIELMHRASVLLCPQLNSVELAGLGCGALGHLVYAATPAAHVIAIESDEIVIDLARRFFRVPDQLEIIHADARRYMDSARHDLVDVVMVDCYGAHMMPPHLCTQEFVTLVRNRLNESGVAIWNLWSESCNALFGYQIETICSVFPFVSGLRCTEDHNVIVCASENPIHHQSVEAKGRRYDWLSAREFCDETFLHPLTDDNLALVLLDVGVHGR